MPATSHHVAKLAGVSQPTVSRALRNDPRVAEVTRERVLEAARALGYVPSEVGRSLSTRATRRVAVVADLANPLYPFLVPPVHDALERRGFRLLLLTHRDEDANSYAPLLDRSVDGVLLTTTRARSPLPFELQKRDIPTVLLNRAGDILTVDSVVADNRGAGRAAAEMLLESGHSSVGLLAGPEDTSTSRDRERGMREALADVGLILHSAHVVHDGFDHDSGERGMRKLMALEDSPRAVVCVSDSVALGALNAARALGLGVPADVAIVGIDDVPYAAWPICDLSTVAVPLTDMASESADLLVDRITGARTGPSVHRVHPVTRIPRGTHGHR